MPALQRRQVTYSGHVQGVGFRYTTQSIARGFDVVGYVRNLPSGQVELVADGAPQELDRFLNEIAEQMSGHIRSVEVSCTDKNEKPAMGEFADFNIRY